MFRKAVEDDVFLIKKIAKPVIVKNYTPFLGNENVLNFIENGFLDKEIDDRLNNCIVLLEDKEIIGFSIVDDNVIHSIMINTKYQHKGYGVKLLFHVEKELFNRYNSITLQSFKDNENANNFYLRNGWCIIGEQYIAELNKQMLLFEKAKLAIK